MAKKSWRDVGDPRKRHAGKVAWQQSQRQQSQPVAQQPAASVRPVVAGGQADRPQMYDGNAAVREAATRALKLKWDAQPTAPLSGFDNKPWAQKIAEDRLGYKPSFYENPTNVAQMYNLVRGGGEVPDWIDRDALTSSYEYFKFQNKDKPWTEWKYLNPDDPGRGYLQTFQTPPAEFLQPQFPKMAERYANADMVKQGQMRWSDLAPDVREGLLRDPNFYQGEITKFPQWAQQEILADPSFDWERLPKWQHAYYGLSSSPAGMGAVQGGLMGAAGGGVAGLLGGGAIGAGIGYVGAKTGYDPTKEFWQQDSIGAKALGALNFLAEQAEKGIGMGVQTVQAGVDPNVALSDVWTKEGWNAGAVTFETLAPALNEMGQEWSFENWKDFDLGDVAKIISSPLYAVGKLTDLMLNPDKYKGQELVLGSSLPVDLQQNFQERITEARERIKNGENYREVVQEFQGGVIAQIGDMAGQAIADPLNVAPQATMKITGKALDVAGFDTAAKATEMASSPMEAVQEYKGMVQSGAVPETFRYSEMSPVARWLADVTIDEAGNPVIKAGALSGQGMLEVPKGNWLQQQVSLDPKSRLLEGHHLAQEHLMQIMTQFDDLHGFQKFFDAVSKYDMEGARDLAGNLANSPEWYTVLPALKEFDGVEKIVNAWDASETSRNLLYQIAETLGEEPRKVLDELARQGGVERTAQRLTSKQLSVSSDQLPGMLNGIKDLFTGDEPVPWHPDLAKATISNSLQQHFADWGVKYFDLKKDNIAFRLADTAKKFQGMLMLGGSPSYPINNQLSNMVMRAVTGNFGYLTPKAIDGFFKDFGYTPHDSGVGVGAFGDPNLAKAGDVRIGEMSAPEKGNLGVAISEATGSTGTWKRVNEMLGAANRALPFGKMSRYFEGVERQNALAISMKKMWPRMWQRGKGFAEMDAGLRSRLEAARPGASELVYRAIESGMNQKQVEQMLFKQGVGLQARGLVERAAAAMGMEKADAAAMMDQMGVFEGLDQKLSKADTPEKVAQVFREVEKTARENFTIRQADELGARMQTAFDRVNVEGPTAAVDIFVDLETLRNDMWLEHYAEAGKTASAIDTLPEWEGALWEEYYRNQESSYRKINSQYLSAFKGVVEALAGKGQQGAELVDLMAREFQNWDDAYRFMKEERGKYFRGEGSSFRSRSELEGAIDSQFRQARATEAKHMQAIGELVSRAFGEQFGPEGGTAFLNKWGDILKFRDQMWSRLQTFRESVLGQPKDVAAAMKRDFYQNQYMPMIAEMGRLKGELGGQGSGVRGQGPDGMGPVPSDQSPVISEQTTAPSYADELAATKAEQAAVSNARLDEVWNVAQAYENTFAPFKRDVLQDKFALLNALRDETFGGMADLTGLNDERVTPEFVRQVLENRDNIQSSVISEQLSVTNPRAVEPVYTGPRINENTSLLRAIQQHGGISKSLALDVTGERNPRTAPGVWTNKGVNIDEMARLLVDDGYPIDLNTPDGGIAQLTEMINRAQSGDKVYPMGHDFEKALLDQEQMFVEQVLDAQIMQQQRSIWEVAAEYGVFGLDEAGQEIPDAGLSLLKIVKKYGGEDGAMARTMADLTPELVERSFTNRDIYLGETRKQLSPEQFAHGLDDLFGKIEKIEKGKDLQKQQGQLLRVRSEVNNALSLMGEMPDDLVNSYAFAAQMLDEKLYAMDQELRVSQLNNRWYKETSQLQADARRILNRNMVKEQLEEAVSSQRLAISGEQIDMAMALMDARAEAWSWETGKGADEWYSTRVAGVESADTDVALQQAQGGSTKGAVEFIDDGRAIVKAFRNADVSTVVHEIGHIFRRDLEGADLQTIEKWAGVKDGKWERGHEEKFARAFEKYLADGKAPSAPLQGVFQKFARWMSEIYRVLKGSPIDVELPEKVRAVFDGLLSEPFPGERPIAVSDQPLAVRPETSVLRQAQDGGRQAQGGDAPATLYQDANQQMPLGGYQQESGWHGEGAWMEEGWTNYVSPLLGAMETEATRQLGETPFNYADLDAETQQSMKRYVNQVKNDMATAKLATVRYGEGMRDFALLNYNRRYGFDKMLDVWAPYQFFYTRSALNGLARVIDKPSWFSNYARLQMMQNRYENNLPERLRGKIRIPAPWMPDWMGDAMYIDPSNIMFQFQSYIQPWERVTQDKKYVEIQAERVLQEWASDGTMPVGELQDAFTNHAGPMWEKAMAEAAQRRNYEQASPFDMAAMFLSPAWYLKNPWYDVTGKLGGYSGDQQLPITRAGQAFETATKGTWAEPVGKFLGLFAKPEKYARERSGLEEFGELDIYYTKRQVANMVADGLIDTEQAQVAMMEQQGEVWEQARERVKMELAMRTPLAAALYAGTHEGLGAGLATLPASLFGSGLLPEGELKYRGLKEKWDAAWKAYDAGDKEALSNFFDDHPEYEAYMAKNKDEGEMLRSFLVGQVWDNYMALDKANRKVVTGQMGQMFQQSFLNKETRSYEAIDTETLAMWSKMLRGQVPNVEATQTVTQAPQYTFPELEGIPPAISASLNKYEMQKEQMFPGVNDIQNIYYEYPKGSQERRRVLQIFPQLRGYWDWRRDYLNDYPEAAQFLDSQTAEAIVRGEQKAVGMDNEQARRLLMYYRPTDFAAPLRTADYYLENSSPVLSNELLYYALQGEPLGSGAQKELQMIWEENGKPGGSLQEFLDDVIVPTLGY